MPIKFRPNIGEEKQSWVLTCHNDHLLGIVAGATETTSKQFCDECQKDVQVFFEDPMEGLELNIEITNLKDFLERLDIEYSMEGSIGPEELNDKAFVGLINSSDYEEESRLSENWYSDKLNKLMVVCQEAKSSNVNVVWS